MMAHNIWEVVPLRTIRLFTDWILVRATNRERLRRWALAGEDTGTAV